MGGPVRLRVVFEDPSLLRGSQRRKGLQQCWLQLRPDLATIADLAAYLHQTFGLRSSCPRGLLLHMNSFILPSFESTCILKDEDIIMVKKNGVVFKDVLKVSDSQNQLQVLQSRQTSALNNSNLASKEPQGNLQADDYDLVLCGGNTAHMETLPIEKGNAQSKRKHSHKLQGSDDTLAAKDSEGDSQGDEDNVGLHGNITCNETSTRKMISKCKRKLTKKHKSSDTLVFKDSQGDSQDEVDVDLANENAAHKETPSSEMTNAKNERKKSSKFKFLGDSLAIKDSQGDSHRDEEDVDLHGNAAQKEAPSQIMKAKHKRKYSKKLEASNTAIMNSQGDLQEAEEGSGFPIGNIVRREAPSSKMANSKHKRKYSNKLQSSDTLAIRDSQGDEEDLDLPNVNVAHPETASSEKKSVKYKRKHSDNLQASEKQSKGNAIAPTSENADGDARKMISGSGQDQSPSRRITHTYRKKKATSAAATTTFATIATPPATTTPPPTAPSYHSQGHKHTPYYPYPPPYYSHPYYPYPSPYYPQPYYPYPSPYYPQSYYPYPSLHPHPPYSQPPYSQPPPPPAEAPAQDERLSIEPEGMELSSGPHELHARTHQRHGTQQWVDPRTKCVHEPYTQSTSGEGSSFRASSRSSDMEMWRAVSGKKKRITYGLGAQGYAYDAQTSYTSTSDYSGQSIQDLLRRNDELTARMANLATQEEARELRRDLKGVQEAIAVLLERTTPT